MGTDIDTIAESLSDRYCLPVIPIHTAGFKGDHKVGMRMACDVLMEYFLTEQKKVFLNRGLNSLGVCSLPVGLL